MRYPSKTFTSLTAMSLAGILSTPVSLAQSGASASELTLEEIVVTSQKREERLQDVPLAVTAVTATALENQQINDTINLTKAVPSLTFQQGNNPQNNTFRIRGVGTTMFSQGVEPSVAVVVDGVVQSRQSQNFTDFADIERVEVLRGPQGTLFGKNATAGVISVVTARPSRSFEAKTSLTVAQKDEYRWNGTVSAPVNEALRVRFTGYYTDIGGYHFNVGQNKKEGDSTSWGLRGKFEWDASDKLNLLFSADYRKSDSHCCQYALVAVSSPVRAQMFAAYGAPWGTDTNYVWNTGPNFSNSKQKTVSVEAGYDLSWAKLVSITAYQDFTIDSNFESDRIGAPTPVFLVANTANAQFDINPFSTHNKQFSQELRLDSQGSGPFTYTAGLYYANLKLDRDAARRRAVCAANVGNVVGQPCVASTISYQSVISEAHLKNDHIAAFGQIEDNIVGGLTLIGGLRIQHESFEVSGLQTGVLVPGDATNANFSAIFPAGTTKDSDSAITGKLGAKYEFSRDAQTYATYTRGYKGLGADTEITTNFSNNPIVKPEHVNAYEVGFKGVALDGRMTYSAAIFRADYTDLQVQANRSDPTTGVAAFVPTNAGSSRTEGVELEAAIRPIAELTMNGGITWLHPSLNIDGLNCPLLNQATPLLLAPGTARPVNTCFQYTSPLATNPNPKQQDVRDGETPVTPHWRVNFSPRYERALGSSALIGFAQVDVSYQSEQQFAIEQDPLQVQPAYTLVDASIGIHDADSRYSLTLFVKNLFDKNFYVTSQGSVQLSTQPALVDRFAIRPKNADRYLGMTAGLKF